MENNPIGPLTSNPIIHRYAGNPILSDQDLPYDSTLVFNAGVTKYQGKYVIVVRNDYGDFKGSGPHGTNLGLAFSDDGTKWEVLTRLKYVPLAMLLIPDHWIGLGNRIRVSGSDQNQTKVNSWLDWWKSEFEW